MASRTDTVMNKKREIPWYVYFVGGVIYTVLAVRLFRESTLPVLAWTCVISAPLGGIFPGQLGNKRSETEVTSTHPLKQDGQLVGCSDRT